MRLAFTAAAQDDLSAIADHVAQDNPERALSFIEEIEDACKGIAHHPQRFPLVARYAGKGVRKRAFGRYLIFCRIGSDAIEILHVLHGAADVDPLL